MSTVGIKCSFLNDAGKQEIWQYRGGEFLDTSKWGLPNSQSDIGYYNLNILAPGTYTLETAINKLMNFVLATGIVYGTKLIFNDADGITHTYTFLSNIGQTNQTRWVEDIDNIYFEWHEAILGVSYDIAGLINSVVVEATGEIDPYAKYSIGQFGYSPSNGCNIIEIYKDNSVIGVIKYEGEVLSAEGAFSNIKIGITVSSFDFRPGGGSIANFNAYNRLNRQLFIDAYETYLINNANEKVNRTVGTFVNINQRFGNAATQYTLEEAIALIPAVERGKCQGLIYLNTVNRPILAIYYAANVSSFTSTESWIEIDCNDITAVTNFSKFQAIAAGGQNTYTLDEVIAAIPRGQRMPGKIVIFKNTEDSKYYLAIFNADSIFSGWTNKSNWILVSFENLKQLSTFSITLQNINTELKKKVDKVEGKGLSTNDFTNEDKEKLDSLTPGPDIPEDVIKEAVDTYIAENDAGLALKDNTLNFIGSHTYKLGENILTTPTVIGTGWSGTMESGFTHAVGNEEALEFDISSVTLNSKILIRFNASGLTTESKEVYVSVGDSPKIKSYNGRTEFVAGVIYAGGTLKFTPASLFDGTISNLRCCIISDEGTEDFYTWINSVANKANDFVYGFWNVLIGNAAAAKAQDITRSIAIGYNAMQDMVVGNRNIAIGTYTMPFLTTGENNVAIGADTIYPLKGANNCVGIGKATLGGSQNAEDCVAIGHNAMGIFTLNNDRLRCVCIGVNSGYSVLENCTHVGYRAGANVIGKNNTSVGYNAMAVGERVSADITGEELTCVGYKAEIDNTSEAKSAVNSTAIGANTKITKSNQLVLGNAAVEEVLIAGKKITFNIDGTVTWTTI